MKESSTQYIDADMEMEGKLVAFCFGPLKETLRHRKRADVYIRIEFKEYPQGNVLDVMKQNILEIFE
jgi:hypothetical protein